MADAKDLEKKLFVRCTKLDKRATLYRKYHLDKRDKPYYPSQGGLADSVLLLHAVYMAWWDKA